jgi:hypothetical protein
LAKAIGSQRSELREFDAIRLGEYAISYPLFVIGHRAEGALLPLDGRRHPTN